MQRLDELVNRNLAQRGLKLPRWQAPIAHHDPVTDLVEQVRAILQVVRNLGLGRLGQHLPRALAQHFRQSVAGRRLPLLLGG
jgi:hypothetical protein